MARLFADEDVDRPIIHELRRLGRDVLTVHEAGHANRCTPDETVLDIAVSEGRALITLNRRHFIRLHGRRPRHSGIIVCTWDADRMGTVLPIEVDLSTQDAWELLSVSRPYLVKLPEKHWQCIEMLSDHPARYGVGSGVLSVGVGC